MEKYIQLEPIEKTLIWGHESWVIAAHENGDGIIKNGVWRGQTLRWLWQNHREYFGNMTGERFPLLIKEITAKDDLSIQVHPDDVYAKVHEHGASGKSECWYILEAKDGASLILGHHAKNREEAEHYVREGLWKEFLNEVPVKAGDFFQIDAGCVHSIKGGIRLLEIQQNSDITYRLYDYNRLSMDGNQRPLHINKSLDVITYEKKQTPPLSIVHFENGSREMLIHTPHYQVDLLKLRGSAYSLSTQNSFLCLDIIQGKGFLDLLPVTEGMHFLIPSQSTSLSLKGKLDIIVSVPQEGSC